MRSPVGSIVGLCSASATFSAMGIAFLGYWGVNEPSPWHGRDVLVVILALISLGAFGSVAWIVTTPVPEEGLEKVIPARRAFAIGLIAVWLAVLVAIIG